MDLQTKRKTGTLEHHAGGDGGQIMPLDWIFAYFRHFNERQIMILDSRAARVNYWARLILALRIPPTGLSYQCDL